MITVFTMFGQIKLEGKDYGNWVAIYDQLMAEVEGLTDFNSKE